MTYYIGNVDGRGGTYGLTARGGYQGLGQDMPPVDWMTQDPAGDPAGGQTVSSAEISSFSSWWGKFSNAWADLQRMGAELADHRARWAAVQAAANNAGDSASANYATERYNLVGTWQVLYGQVLETISRYSDTWDQIKSYVSSFGQWVGLSGLGVFPLLLPVAIGAAIAALAWVINRWQDLRANLIYDRQLLQSAEAGRISGRTAADLAAARRGGGASSLMTQGANLLTWGVVGVLAVMLFRGMSPRGAPAR